LKNKYIVLLLVAVMVMIPCLQLRSQTPWNAESWASADNLTAVMDTAGLTELSGLHWNPVFNRLYVVHGDGKLRVLQFNNQTQTFTQLASKSITGGPEGVTQVNYSSNEFYTIDESSYQIRKYTHNTGFSSLSMAKSWNLLISPSPMPNTGNTGPEGIAFIPDSFLIAAGFISQQTGQAYTSTRGMGGLMFIAHQNQGYIWVFDINPDVTDDFVYVGKYRTNSSESCDLEFDRSTGMLYILHNIAGNTLEITDLSTYTSGSDLKFTVKAEYMVPNPDGNTNIEGFGITPKCNDSSNVSVWFCRDVEIGESSTYKKDCLRWFNPVPAIGNCHFTSGILSEAKPKFSLELRPNPASHHLEISISGFIDGTCHIELFDLNGVQVLNKPCYHEQNIILNVGTLPDGLYFVRIISDQYSLIQKVIIQH
jgi:hypothetical protein